MIGNIALEHPVLLVDDANATRYATRRILIAAGAQVVEAISGAEALNLAPACGAVVLDVNLPDMDGFAVCQALRASPATQHLPIVHLTARRLRDEDKIRGLDAGGDAYLTHPVEPGVLIATLNALLRTRAAEQSELLSRTRFEAVFRTAPVGIALLATDGRLLDINAELLRILSSVGHPMGLAPAVEDLPEQLRSGLEQHQEKQDSDGWNVSIPVSNEPGAWKHLNCHVTLIGPDATFLLVLDNTKKHSLELERQQLLESERRARAEAEEANRAKDVFIALLSHELRNPLAPISAAAQLLQMSTTDEVGVRKASAVILRQIKHMTQLIDDLMDVSRVTHGLVELSIAHVDLTSVVAAALEQVRPLIEARRHVLTTCSVPGAAVMGDRTRLVQVLANLLNNAAKYTPPGGKIEVRVAVDGSHARISVQDNGNGLSEALLPNLFASFTQGVRSADRSEGGLGIGLALVKGVVLLHGGTVDAQSAGAGRGSVFTVTLPLATAPRVADTPVPDIVSRATGSAARVMVVDDNIDAATMLAELIGLAGYDVEVFHDAAAALARVGSNNHFQAFVLDIGLPGMTGHQLAVQIREKIGPVPATFIAVTGYGQAEDRLLSKTAGFDHHFLKPVDADDLLEALREASARSL